MQNYANDVVAAIQIACDSRKIQAPIIISESGRAIASHQSILVVNVLGVDTVEKFNHTIEVENCHQLVQEISEIYDEINESNCQESYHDILQVKKEVESLFSFGYISLYERGKAESLFWKCCDKIKTILQQINSDIDELEKLQQLLISTYYCNFSVFKSLPDSWSIEQLFPIMPIHRLDEQPNQRGILADITCDSDGKISQFIDHQTVKNYLELHQWDQDKPYYLGVFLSGAYQESLGSLHNLFGDTNTVYIHLNYQGDYLESVIKGDSIAQVLKSVKYDSKNMIKTMQKKTEKALEEKRITLEESLLFLNHYENALCHNTYLK
jgi:arginine decarboxylase